MKKMKAKEVIALLEKDGWYQLKNKRTGGSHKQYKHPTKKGKVTINKKDNEDIDQFTLNSIWKQAGWK
ncbi:MAG: type II toxin-antitoxin system HicA family toxin [Muribaculaceae bacterium]|nr:type II toxin-antitoxin system HicA family toxin [Muribaculaceae bacterium]